jgi:hypothetical protein
MKNSLLSLAIALVCLTQIPTSRANPGAINPGQNQGRKQVKVYFYHEPGEYNA